MQAGAFTEASELERFKEIRELIASMKNEITIDTGTAASSIYFKAALPEDKKKTLEYLDGVIAGFTEDTERKLHSRRARMISV